MNAADVLHAAHTAGITVMLDGDGILLEADAEPPRELLEALARHKPAILDLLKPVPDGWCPADWRAYLDARIRQVASRNGCSRAQAAALAFECCVIEWLNRHPAPSPPGRCVWCGGAESSGAVILPFGTEPGTHAWLHSECWHDWHSARRADAAALLNSMGIRA
jgi:hypothetical protein